MVAGLGWGRSSCRWSKMWGCTYGDVAVANQGEQAALYGKNTHVEWRCTFFLSCSILARMAAWLRLRVSSYGGMEWEVVCVEGGCV